MALRIRQKRAKPAGKKEARLIRAGMLWDDTMGQKEANRPAKKGVKKLLI